MSDNCEFILSQYYEMFENEDENAMVTMMDYVSQQALHNISIDNTSDRRRRIVNRRREKGHHRLWKDYFADAPVYSDNIFRRRFRMKRPLFNRIHNVICEYDPYFVQTPDAVGKMGLSSYQKIVAALRMLAYGSAADIWDEYICIGESTTLQTVLKFSKAMVAIFGPIYTRSPTVEDIVRLSAENTERGFLGMLGSIDCMHWEWKNCPHALEGQYKGHKHKPTIILEAVASYDTWIWKSFFGMPETSNDINVLHRSNVFEDLLKGRMPQIQYQVNGNSYDMGYYLGDGIYPPYATIVKSFKKPTTQKQQLFSQAQESARKDVERAFGILQSRFAFIHSPAKLWNKDALAIIMKTCIIMHNMIVEDERRDNNWRPDYEQCQQVPNIERHPTDAWYSYMAKKIEMQDKQKHLQLRYDLVEHIWETHSTSNPELQEY